MIHQEIDNDHDWVFLPDNNGFLEINQDGEEKIHGGKTNSDKNLVFLPDYFNKEQPPGSGNPRGVLNQVVPFSFPLEPRIFKGPENELRKETTTRVPFDVIFRPSMIPEKIKEPVVGSAEVDNKEVKTQVSFRKPSYNESVDMTNKMDSPKPTSRGVIPQIDATGTFNFDEKIGVLENKSSPRKKDLVEKKVENKEDVTWEGNSGGLNLWKWSLTGIGAICSFGVAAAATFCIIILGSQKSHRQQQQDQKLLFQRYTDEKRMKQGVNRTTKLNEAISAVRVPITRAHITFGGYYNGL